ncbi:facilitated trehalose transporter Tret1-like [Planococcus citri]|uniref:facilitated trehalose transporter Tret1-like n=1 Tax=Planococcus citri TaxID=170843 RepID=UPI0031F83EB7
MPKVTSFFRQILVLIPVYVGSIFSGMGYSWVASYMMLLQSEENNSTPYTIQQCTLLALAMHIGRITSAFISVLVLGKFGRKIPLIIAYVLFLISAGMVLISTAYVVVASSRFVNGIANGVHECFGTIYLGEIPSKKIRGMICSSVTAFFNFGILAQYALGTYMSYVNGAILRISLATVLVLSTYYLIESPYHLKPLDSDKAMKTIAWLQAIPSKQAQQELENINVENANLIDFVKRFKKPEVYKSFGLALSLGFIATVMTVVVSSFANFIIPETDYLNSHQFAILLTIVPIVMYTLSALIIDHLGRRLLLLVGFSLGIFFNALITLLYYMEETSILNIPNFSWVIFFIIVMFLITYFLSISPTANALRTELFPTSCKVIGVSLTVVCNSLAYLFGTVFFLRISEFYGLYLNFLIYCVCCLVGLILVSAYLPETKGKSLSEIQEILRGENKTVS